jgi:hypothetical protein
MAASVGDINMAIPTGLTGSELALQNAYGGTIQGLQGGLTGSESALQGGLAGYEKALQGGLAGAQAQLNPYATQGGQAFNLQSALTGALGNQAQSQAFQNYQESPGQAWLRQQGERSRINQAAATGGTQGGNILKELTRFGTGLAAQDFGNQINRLGTLSGMGANASGQMSNNFMSTGQNIASGRNQFGQNLASGRTQFGRDLGSATTQLGQNLAQGRTNYGQQMAGNIGATTSALSQLQQQQGAGLANIYGSAGGNLSQLLAGSGQTQGQSLQNLAAMLANISTGQGSQVAGLPGIPGVQQSEGALGGVGSALEGVAALMLASDARLKENIQQIGETPAGVKLYSWDWNEKGREIAGDQPTVGVMAQELMKTNPEAVIMAEDGYYRVDYSRVH